jgi:AcrR family transcriptional regulator
LDVFGKVGVATATLDQIAERAGVSKGTIYLYFANKEELFRQTIRNALTSAVIPVDGPRVGSTSRQLGDTIATQWWLLTREPTVTAIRLLTSEQWQYPDLAELYATDVITPFSDGVATILEAGAGTGEFRSLDSRAAARMLAALVVQTAGWRASGGGPFAVGQSSEDILRELIEFYFQAVSPLDSAFPQADGA